jgi:hypothetical protein
VATLLLKVIASLSLWMPVAFSLLHFLSLSSAYSITKMGFNELLFGVSTPVVPASLVSSDCDYDGESKFDLNFKPEGLRFDSSTRAFLEGMGPVLVISDKTTGGDTTIRWRLRSSGTNTSMFFGVVPANDPTNPRHLDSAGCASIMTSSTASSHVTRKFDFDGSTLEVVSDGKTAQFLLHPASGPPKELYSLPLTGVGPYRLAVTLYRNGGIEIL